ncbi:MAG: hypothetical protein SFZ03_04825 [Candidatus Melainabacteria bacterium]|nr:hypothetical protein [Candidatus Melainabacteria bacterium]
MSFKTFRYFQNTGGLNLTFNDVLIDEREAEEVLNLHATSSGSWTTRNVGYKSLNPTNALAGGSLVGGLYEYRAPAGSTHFMAIAGDKIHTFEPATGAATLLYSGLTPNRRMHCTTFQGRWIGCNGADTPKVWDGVNPVGDLSNWPPTIAGITPGAPSMTTIFANRLVFSGDANNPSVLYLSELENPDNFTPGTGATAAGAIQVSPGDGQRITAIKSMYLPLESEEILVVFKERSTYMLTGSDADSFQLQQVSDEFGAVSPHCVIRVGNDLLFLSEEGITSLSTATVQGNITTNLLSTRIRPQMNTLNRSQLSASHAAHLRHRQEVWWFVPDGSASQNQRVLVLHYGNNSGPTWSRRSGIIAASSVVMNGTLYTGSYTGVVQQQMTGSSYDGAAIPWIYRTGFYDLGSPRLRKRVKDVEVFLKQLAELNVTVRTGWDIRRGSTVRESRTLTVTPNTASTIYGAAYYNTDRYDAAGVSILKFIPSGSGRFFQLEFNGQAANKPVELEGWTITAIAGGPR